jgi:Bacterial PH domain
VGSSPSHRSVVPVRPEGNACGEAKARDVLADADEEICLEARRHGIVLARPLFWAIVLGGAGGVLVTLPRPFSLGGAAVVAFGALVALRAVWKWERTRVVVTTEKVFVVGGTWRRNARAVRLAAVEAVELEQTFPGQLLGYGTVVVGPLALDHVPKPKSVYRLVERLTG